MTRRGVWVVLALLAVGGCGPSREVVELRAACDSLWRLQNEAWAAKSLPDSGRFVDIQGNPVRYYLLPNDRVVTVGTRWVTRTIDYRRERDSLRAELAATHDSLDLARWWLCGTGPLKGRAARWWCDECPVDSMNGPLGRPR